MTRVLPLIIALAGTAFAGHAAAQAAATGSVTIRQAVAVSSQRPMRFQAQEQQTSLGVSTEGGQADAPAVIQVTGDPDRAYRIRLPQTVGADGAVIEGLKVSSLTSGDITGLGVARMDAEGRDLLSISGRLKTGVGGLTPGAPASLLVSIVYE